MFATSRSSARNSSCAINSVNLEELQAEKGTETFPGILCLYGIYSFCFEKCEIKSVNSLFGEYSFIRIILSFKLIRTIFIIKICSLHGGTIC